VEISVEATGFMTRYIEGAQAFSAAEWGGKPVAELLDELPIPASVTYIIMINGERKKGDAQLSAGDEIKLVPLLVGG
jgi:sulfur carrier protein ThiS